MSHKQVVNLNDRIRLTVLETLIFKTKTGAESKRVKPRPVETSLICNKQRLHGGIKTAYENGKPARNKCFVYHDNYGELLVKGNVDDLDELIFGGSGRVTIKGLHGREE